MPHIASVGPAKAHTGKPALTTNGRGEETPEEYKGHDEAQKHYEPFNHHGEGNTILAAHSAGSHHLAGIFHERRTTKRPSAHQVLRALKRRRQTPRLYSHQDGRLHGRLQRRTRCSDRCLPFETKGGGWWRSVTQGINAPDVHHLSCCGGRGDVNG